MKKEMDPRVVEIEENFRQVCTKIKMKGRSIFNEFEITPPQFAALLELLDQGDMTTSELSARMYLACSTVTDLLDRMERNALIERRKDEKDKRIVRIHVLEKGHRLIDEILQVRCQYIESVISELPSEAVDEIERCFAYLNKHMTF